MKIVIDIPDNIYDAIKSVQTIVSGQRSGKTLLQILVSSVENGTPLPKNHGDLIDKNELIKMYKKDCGRRIYADNFIFDLENNATTIIEADKAESEEEE